MHAVVRVHAHEVRSTRRRKRKVERLRDAARTRASLEHENARIARRQCIEHQATRVGAAVVDRNDLEPLLALREDRREAFVEPACGVAHRERDRDKRRLQHREIRPDHKPGLSRFSK